MRSCRAPILLVSQIFLVTHARPQRGPRAVPPGWRRGRGRTTGGRHRELDFVRALASVAYPSRRPVALCSPPSRLWVSGSCFLSCRGAGGRRGGGRWPASTDGTSTVPALASPFGAITFFFSVGVDGDGRMGGSEPPNSSAEGGRQKWFESLLSLASLLGCVLDS